MGSDISEAAANVERLRRHRGSLRQGEVVDHFCYFGGRDVASNRDPFFDALLDNSDIRIPNAGVVLTDTFCHLGLNEARAYCIHSDTGTVSRKFQAQRLGEADHAMLRGGIWRSVNDPLLPPGGSDVDDATALRDQPLREGLPGHIEGTVQVCSDHLIPRVDAEFSGDSASGDSGAIDQNSDAWNTGGQVAQCCLNACTVPDIKSRCENFDVCIQVILQLGGPALKDIRGTSIEDDVVANRC